MTRRNSGPRRKSMKVWPNLWSRLPAVIIDVILHKIVSGLTFSRLLQFSRFFKRWKGIFRASTPYLVYFRMGALIAFNSRRGLWERISLDFCADRVPGLDVKCLHLVSSGGGLLCLSNTVDGEYIVCNPLTKRCNRLSRPAPASGDAEPKLQTRVVAYSMWLRERQLAQSATPPAQSVPHEVLVYHADIRGAFQLMVNSNSHRSEGRMAVSEFTGSHWRRAAEITNGFCFFINGPIMQAPGVLSVGFKHAAQPSGWVELLVYDLKQRKCSWVGPVERLPVNTTNRSRKHLVGSLVAGRKLEFMDIVDTGSKRPAFPQPLGIFEALMDCMPGPVQKRIRRRGTMVKMVYVEQDDDVYYVVVASAFPEYYSPPAGGPGRVFRILAVCLHNRADNSDIVSPRNNGDWGFMSSRCPVGACFHIFKPSFESPG